MQQMTVYYVMFDELSAGTNDIHQEKKQKLHRNAIIMHAAFVKKVKTKKKKLLKSLLDKNVVLITQQKLDNLLDL